MKKNIWQKIFDWFLKRLEKTCKKYYTPLVYSEREMHDIPNETKCANCPFEYLDGCYVMRALRERKDYVPVYWSNKRKK